MKLASQSFLVGFDTEEGNGHDETVLVVYRQIGNRLEQVNCVRGQEAIDLCEKLTNQKFEEMKGGNENE